MFADRDHKDVMKSPFKLVTSFSSALTYPTNDHRELIQKSRVKESDAEFNAQTLKTSISQMAKRLVASTA